MAKQRTVMVTIETPRGSAEKFALDASLGAYVLKRVLPAGMRFPYDFGFVPGTKAEDGDPIDVIVLSEFKSFPGCVVECRVVGAMLAEQRKQGSKKAKRNDRILAIAACSRDHDHVQSIADLPAARLDALEAFFRNYHEQEGTTFEPVGRAAAKAALRLIERSKSHED
jgi:inorganic pyrophosphatase